MSRAALEKPAPRMKASVPITGQIQMARRVALQDLVGFICDRQLFAFEAGQRDGPRPLRRSDKSSRSSSLLSLALECPTKCLSVLSVSPWAYSCRASRQIIPDKSGERVSEGLTLTRKAPRRTGSDSTTLTSPRPVIIAASDPSALGRIANILEFSGLPAVGVFSHQTLKVAAARLAPALVILDIDTSWGIQAGTELRREGVRTIAISDDEVAQLRALRHGFLEALPKDVSRDAFIARIRALITLPQEVPPRADSVTGLLRIDPLERTASWEGTSLNLARAPFDLLSYLAERSGLIVPKAQLKRDFQWGEDNALHQAIWELRRALGPVVAAHIITRPRYGYGYLPVLTKADAPVRDASAPGTGSAS